MWDYLVYVDGRDRRGIWGKMVHGLQCLLELEFYCQSDREPWEVSNQGRLMFRSACYKDLSGAGVADGLEG